MKALAEKYIDKTIYFGRSFNSNQIQNNETIIQKASELRENGYVIIEDLIPKDVLEYFQEKIKPNLEEGRIKYPCLAQAKIDPEKHKSLISNHLFSTPENLEEMGLALKKSDFTSLEETIKNFCPSTLTLEAFSTDPKYFNLWLDETILKIISLYMGVRPFLIEAYIRRNLPAKYRSMNHYWHRDLNHKKYLVKAFIFFSDCSVKNGPHEYVPKSHKDLTLNGKRYFTDEEVDSAYPPNQRKRSVVKAGTIVLEDTRGLHRAIIPEEGFRDMGFAVFLPLPFYNKKLPLYYNIDSEVFKSLTKFQRSFIPPQFISN